MAGLTSLKPSASYKSLLRVDDNTDGVDGTLEVVTDGEGTATPLKISSSAVIGTPLYTHFGTTASDSLPSIINTHTAIPFGNLFASNVEVTFGTDPNPATSLTISTTADDVLGVIWYVPDDITIVNVYVWAAGNTGNADTIRFHLMSYDIVTTDGATCGDLSNGTVVADGDDIEHLGNEQADFRSMTIQSANVDAGKSILLMIRADSLNSDYSINATVKYHLR